MPRREELQDEQWALIEPLLPKRRRRADGRGRPACSDRAVLNGILWILRSGARWKDLPERFPSYQTCHRRFQQWVEDGTLTKVLRCLAEDLRSRGQIDIQECFIDGTFASAKKGALELGKLSGARVRSSWRWQTALVFLSPLAWALLRPTKSRSSSQRSLVDSWTNSPND
jgi:transposase